MIKMLIDCDTGIDDSIAILFALKRPDVRVLGITTGCGNIDAYQAAEIPSGSFIWLSPAMKCRWPWEPMHRWSAPGRVRCLISMGPTALEMRNCSRRTRNRQRRQAGT